MARKKKGADNNNSNSNSNSNKNKKKDKEPVANTSSSRAGKSRTGASASGPTGPTFTDGRIVDLTMVQYGESDDPPNDALPIWFTTKEVGSRAPYEIDIEEQFYERAGGNEEEDSSDAESNDELEEEEEEEEGNDEDGGGQAEQDWDVETYRIKALMNGRLHYEVKWKGWDDADNTFECMENLDNSLNEVKRFELSSGGLDCLRFRDPKMAKQAAIWRTFAHHVVPERVMAWDEKNRQCLLSWVNTGDVSWMKLEILMKLRNGPKLWFEFLHRNGSRLWDFRRWDAVPTLYATPQPSWDGCTVGKVLERSACPPERPSEEDPLRERYIEKDALQRSSWTASGSSTRGGGPSRSVLNVDRMDID